MVCNGILWVRKASIYFPFIATMSNNDENEEIEGLKRLDHQTIGQIYDRYFPLIYRYVQYRLSDLAQVEDLASEVFMRLLEATKKGNGPHTNVKAWLLSTASHVVNDHHRKAYRRPTEAISESIVDGDPSPSETSEQRERRRRVRMAISLLTPEQQHVLDLRFGQELTLEETATVMNKNVNAVKQLQFRALAALNRLVDEI